MKKITFYSLAVFLVINMSVATAQTDLLANATEDGSFSGYTLEQTQTWPPHPGSEYWDADGTKGGTRTSVRVHNTEPDNPDIPVKNYNSKYHYLQVLMDNGTLGSNYIWRKITGLTPGATYTIQFYYRMTHTLADRGVKFGVTDNIANIVVNPMEDAPNSLNGLLGGSLLDFPSVAATSYTSASYTFNVPAGKTEIYAVWLRSHRKNSLTGTMRIFLDDMSLFLGVSTSTNPLQAERAISIYPNPVKDYLTINTTEEIKHIMITDITGRTVLNVSNRYFEGIDVSHLQSGSYLIHITGKVTYIQRFIKK